jgi:hypothetical protein
MRASGVEFSPTDWVAHRGRDPPERNLVFHREVLDNVVLALLAQLEVLLRIAGRVGKAGHFHFVVFGLGSFRPDLVERRSRLRGKVDTVDSEIDRHGLHKVPLIQFGDTLIGVIDVLLVGLDALRRCVCHLLDWIDADRRGDSRTQTFLLEWPCDRVAAI